MPRLLIALRPPPAVAAVLDRWSAGIDLPADSYWMAPQDRHVTLRFLGEGDYAPAIAAMRSVVLPPTRCTFGPAAFLPFGPEILQLPVSFDTDLVARVERATEGIGPEPTPFFGHMEIARSRGSLAALDGRPFSHDEQLHEIELVESHWIGDRARFQTIESWTLPGPD